MTQIETSPMGADQPIRGAVPLFDIDGLDLSSLALSREDLEDWNPHRGAIVQLDGVIWHDAEYSQGVGIKKVRDNEFWVDGHFPRQAGASRGADD